ncbi:hypothetical protein TRVA0_039S00452 [Trichomonascus vanleenenianus]|uniref:uncharacterized protein n=1 Tax=Trichomonascus vanleenenianus TaxID=2268995 RepID=UPI003ECB9FB1
MPINLPFILLAGATIGLGAAIYANREELKELYNHRDELFDLLQQKRLEWKLRKRARDRERRRQVASHSNPIYEDASDSRSVDTLKSLPEDEVYSLYDYGEGNESHGNTQTYHSGSSSYASNHYSPSTTGQYSGSTFVPNGRHGSSSEAETFYSVNPSSYQTSTARDIPPHEGDLRRRGVELNQQHEENPNSSTSDVELYHYSGAPRGPSEFSEDEVSEPAPSFDTAVLSPAVSHRNRNWFRSTSSVDDSYSEISTPSVTDGYSDDYQHLIYNSDDEQQFRLQTATH